MPDPPARNPRASTPDDQMSREEKEAFVDKTEEFEGPDRREVRSEEEKHPDEPGVSRS